MKKASFVLIVALVGALLLGALPAPAAGRTVDRPDRAYPYSTYYNTDVSVPENTTWEVPARTTLRVEKGATMTVYGKLQVNGTLKLYGTLRIVDREIPAGRRESTTQDSVGRVSVVGNMENRGVVDVYNGELEVRPTGELDNYGEILLRSDKEDRTALRITGWVDSAPNQGGRLINHKKGKIQAQTADGVALRVMKGAVLRNDGDFAMAPGTLAYGEVQGNAPYFLFPKESKT